MKKVLIANRGEIAVRIVRACRDHGVASVAVYADSDHDSLHVQLADEAWGLDGERAAQTYLDMGKLLRIARRSGADAVHPGYGFLAENAAFAAAVTQAGLTWIGPSADVITQLGDKLRARQLAREIGVPLAAGTDAPVTSASEVRAFAQEHGLPIVIKAAHGGGGRGLKVVLRMEDIEDQYASAVRESEAAFGRHECFVEQYLDRPRHIEAQVIADRYGQLAVVGTRDCSLQRRNQKLVEEAPAPFLTEAQEAAVLESAAKLCRHVGYVGAGTVEFLLSQTGQLAFLEVNTRLQVEHTVTEVTSGHDLVVEQLRIAAGERLRIPHRPAILQHAIEFRINAEDVGRGFLPATGTIERFLAPAGPGVRVDSGVASGSIVGGGFDSLLAKLIVHGRTRQEALARARRALAEFEITGVPSVLPFHRAIVEHAAFTGESGFAVHTRWIDASFDPRDIPPASRPSPVQDRALVRFPIEWDGKRIQVALPAGLALPGLPAAPAGMHPLDAARSGPRSDTGPTATATANDDQLIAPVSGLLSQWSVPDGTAVQPEQLVAVMEAMKTDIRIHAPRAGTLHQQTAAGNSVQAGLVIGTIE